MFPCTLSKKKHDQLYIIIWKEKTKNKEMRHFYVKKTDDLAVMMTSGAKLFSPLAGRFFFQGKGDLY